MKKAYIVNNKKIKINIDSIADGMLTTFNDILFENFSSEDDEEIEILSSKVLKDVLEILLEYIS